jgi:hypothetical protein
MNSTRKPPIINYKYEVTFYDKSGCFIEFTKKIEMNNEEDIIGIMNGIDAF